MGLFRNVCGATKVESPGGRTRLVSGEPSPQSSATVLVWIPPGLTIVPLAVIVVPSLTLEDESTRPGAANVGAGSLMATTTAAVDEPP